MSRRSPSAYAMASSEQTMSWLVAAASAEGMSSDTRRRLQKAAPDEERKIRFEQSLDGRAADRAVRKTRHGIGPLERRQVGEQLLGGELDEVAQRVERIGLVGAAQLLQPVAERHHLDRIAVLAHPCDQAIPRNGRRVDEIERLAGG